MKELDSEVVSLIDLFVMLRFHAELLLAVGGILYRIHPICEGLSGVGPMCCLLLGIETHERFLLMYGRILLGVFIDPCIFIRNYFPIGSCFDAILVTHLC